MQQISFQFIFTPIAINTLTVLLLTLQVNRLVLHRLYACHPLAEPPTGAGRGHHSSPYSSPKITHTSFLKVDSYIDVDEDGLLPSPAHMPKNVVALSPCLRKGCKRKLSAKRVREKLTMEQTSHNCVRHMTI